MADRVNVRVQCSGCGKGMLTPETTRGPSTCRPCRKIARVRPCLACGAAIDPLRHHRTVLETCSRKCGALMRSWRSDGWTDSVTRRLLAIVAPQVSATISNAEGRASDRGTR